MEETDEDETRKNYESILGGRIPFVTVVSGDKGSEVDEDKLTTPRRAVPCRALPCPRRLLHVPLTLLLTHLYLIS